ncbi:MAG: P63C domain-containing protein [Pseudomonadota bacterium]
MNQLSDKPKNGGIARDKALSPEKKSEIAKQGADARWKGDIPEVLCEGMLDLGIISIPCYVTHDGQRLISGRGMQEALRLVDEGLPESGQKPGSRMTRLLNNKNLRELIFKNKSADHFLPIRVRWKGIRINGYNAEMLADICEGMLEARNKMADKLSPRHAIVAAQCELLLRAFARVGITALVDEATGYQKLRPADGLKSYFDLILRKELAAWFKRFPDEYYENIYRLRGWEWPGMQKNRYSVVSKYTNDLMYERMMPGLPAEFKQRNPRIDGKKKGKDHMLLDENGEKLFAQQMFTVIALQRACLNKTGNKWDKFMRMMDDILPKKGKGVQLNLPNLSDDSSNG